MVDSVNRGITNFVPPKMDDGLPPIQNKGSGAIKHAGALPLQDIKASSGLGGTDPLIMEVLKGATQGQDKAEVTTMLHQMSATENEVIGDIFAFMALFQKLAQEMRNANREIRTTELQGQISELQNAAAEMRDAAGKRFAAAITQSAMQIVGGALQFGMSAGSLAATAKSVKLDSQSKEALNLSKSLENTPQNVELRSDLRTMSTNLGGDATKASALSQNLNSMGQASSQMMGGLGGAIAAGMTQEADLADARKMEAETRSREHEINVQHANDVMQQMMDVIRDIRDKLSSINQASVETNRGIARNI